MKYKVIKTKEQYSAYCQKLEELVFSDDKNDLIEDEIELLTLLIEQWDKEQNSFDAVDLMC